MLLAAIRFVNTLQLLSLHDRNLITDLSASRNSPSGAINDIKFRKTHAHHLNNIDLKHYCSSPKATKILTVQRSPRLIETIKALLHLERSHHARVEMIIDVAVIHPRT